MDNKIAKLSIKEASTLRDKVALEVYNRTDKTALGAYRVADAFLAARRTEKQEVSTCSCAAKNPKKVNTSPNTTPDNKPKITTTKLLVGLGITGLAIFGLVELGKVIVSFLAKAI